MRNLRITADKKAELLAPAGDMERLEMALLYGADAVYLAGREFGMRAAAGNFDADQLRQAVRLCREKGVRVYVTCNTLPRNDEIVRLPEFLELLRDIGADAVIVGDLGVFSLAKKYAPGLDIHISTQVGIVNYESARSWYDLGAKRVVLARELSLKEIEQIRAKTPRELELEAFVHGSMCVSFSGRCLLSNYLTGRDANRGACAQPCRWRYHLIEEKRPGEYMEITEDGGTHILNSRDMCMIDHLPKLIGAGVYGMKLEGRMKSAYYVAVITNAYRKALDAAISRTPLDPVWANEVNKVSHRDYFTGFYFGDGGGGEYYEDAHYFADCDVVGIVEDCDREGNAIVSQRNRFFSGDRLELLTPCDKPVYFEPEQLKNMAGEEIDAAPHPMMSVSMKLPFYAPRNSVIRKDKPDKI